MKKIVAVKRVRVTDANNERRDILNLFSFKCFRCEFVRCVDFFREIGELEGNELFVLAGTVNSRKILPCVSGTCIECLCRFALAISKTDTDIPIFYLLLQCIRDLKCSVFLAFCGHYRNAMQVLRSVVENFLTGVYFTCLEDVNAFEKWINGKYEVPDKLYREVFGKSRKLKFLNYDFILKFLVKKKVISHEFKEWVRSEIIWPLNEFLHPHFPSFEISEKWGNHSDCPAAVKFNGEKLKEWLTLFQKIIWFILRSLFDIFGYEYFEGDEDARESLSLLIITPEVMPDYILSSEYKDLLNILLQRYREKEKELEEI
jgi:hypothetical protein